MRCRFLIFEDGWRRSRAPRGPRGQICEEDDGADLSLASRNVRSSGAPQGTWTPSQTIVSEGPSLRIQHFALFASPGSIETVTSCPHQSCALPARPVAQVQGPRSLRARCLLGAMPVEKVPKPKKGNKAPGPTTLESLAVDVQCLEGPVKDLQQMVFGKDGGDGQDGLAARFQDSLRTPCPMFQTLTEDITELQAAVKRIDGEFKNIHVLLKTTNARLTVTQTRMEETMKSKLQELAQGLVKDLDRPIQQQKWEITD